MRLNIINPNTLELEGVLTKFESVQWEPTFNTSDGKFQINCSEDYFNLLQLERYVENTEDTEHVGVIKQVKTITSNESSSIQVSGIMLEKDLFSRRVVKLKIVYEDMYPTAIINSLIGLSLINSAETNRIIPTIGQVIFPKDADIPDLAKTNYSANYPNLCDEVYSLIQGINLGVKARINHSTNKIDIVFYTGNDYTYGSNDPIVFSIDTGTITESEYTKDSSQNVTNLILIGEDDVMVQVERDREANEPIVEKSMDVSGDCPWPTYNVEKPNEDGGQYYKYVKYNAPADFISNREVWEKYAVDKIETTETLYREVVAEPVAISGDDLVSAYPDISAGTSLDSKNGFISNSISDTAGALGLAMLNSNGFVGNIKEPISSITANLSANSASVQQASTMSLKSAKAKKAKPKKTTTKTATLHTTTSSSMAVASSVCTSTGVSTDIKVTTNEETQEPVVTATEVTLEPYTVTTVTYETKDFLDYVYVNPGQPPTDATKIIEGSVESGEVMYYENFEAVKIDEVKYREALINKAKSYLKTYITGESLDVTPYALSNVVYKKTYNVGDIITAKDKKFGFYVDMRVSSVSEVWDSKGHTVSLTLGDSVPSLTNRIKLISKGGA